MTLEERISALETEINAFKNQKYRLNYSGNGVQNLLDKVSKITVGRKIIDLNGIDPKIKYYPVADPDIGIYAITVNLDIDLTKNNAIFSFHELDPNSMGSYIGINYLVETSYGHIGGDTANPKKTQVKITCMLAHFGDTKDLVPYPFGKRQYCLDYLIMEAN